ncbi:MAG: hypothetical protein KJ067_23255 [Vicinamibacteria bacterium]|nr:hypothetical protein [Vicinamibacteria bacterium]
MTLRLLVVALSLLGAGCGSELTLRIGGPPKAPDTVEDDIQVLALCATGTLADQQACAEAQLIRTGVKPEEAAKRVLKALRSANSAKAGRAKEEGR